jgi:ferredoxin-NADP reductase
VDLVLPNGVVRPYSLAGDPGDDRTWRVLVARSTAAEGGASAYVHDVLRTGDLVRVRAPRNLFPLEGASRYLFLASGAGIAPVLPMVRRVHSARIYPWTLLYVDRSSTHSPLRAEVEALGTGARSVSSRTPVLTALAEATPGTAVYACGSSRFVDVIAEAAAPQLRVHRERFDAPTRASGPDRPFELVLARRGERIRVEPGTPMVTALHRAGVDVPVSCGAGICGACILAVAEGAVEHRDSLLSPEERAAGRLMVTCVSRAAGRELALDV